MDDGEGTGSRSGAPPLRWAVTGTGLGTVLAVAGEAGLVAVRIGADPDALLAEVAAEHPAAPLAPDGSGLAPVLAALRALAAGEPAGDDPALAAPGTAFQHRVWAALRAVPAGETRTYREVAVGLGLPTAVRAVAGACAANRVALVVPCHRVVRSDGGLGGYRWGLEVKQRLLEAERSRAGRPREHAGSGTLR